MLVVGILVWSVYVKQTKRCFHATELPTVAAFLLELENRNLTSSFAFLLFPPAFLSASKALSLSASKALSASWITNIMEWHEIYNVIII